MLLWKKGLKIFVGYKIEETVTPLTIRLLQMFGYVKNFDIAKTIFCLVQDGNLSKKYNKIWEKVSNIIKKGFDSEPVFNSKYFETKIKTLMQIIIVVKYQ